MLFNFGPKTFLDSKFVWTQKIFKPKIILDQKFYWTQHFFGPNIFLRPKINFEPNIFFGLGDLHQRGGIKPFQTEQFRLKGPIRFCHSARKIKSSKLDLKVIEGTLLWLKNHRGFSTPIEHLRIFCPCLMPSVNCKNNLNIFAFLENDKI